MKTHQQISVLKPILMVLITFFISVVIFAQEELPHDSTIQEPTLQDTIPQEPTIQDTILQEPTMQDSTIQDSSIVVANNVEEPIKEKKETKRKDSFKIFAGGTLNALNVSSDMYESSEDAGFMLGVSYKRGKFFYYEFGARYNQYGYKLTDLSIPGNGQSSFSVSVMDIPLNVGINFTSFVERIIGVRIFAGLVPAFRLSVGDNDLGITKESTNTFNFHGQAGVGVDVAFLFLESGINYGFGDLLKNDVQSNPVQVFINLGFRF